MELRLLRLQRPSEPICVVYVFTGFLGWAKAASIKNTNGTPAAKVETAKRVNMYVFTGFLGWANAANIKNANGTPTAKVQTAK